MEDGTNAKEEFLERVGKKKVICAKIGIDKEHYGNEVDWIILKEKHTKEEFEQFLKELDFEYDGGYGSQELFGTILLKDRWFDRHEYDGAESWSEHKMPTIRQVLGNKY